MRGMVIYGELGASIWQRIPLADDPSAIGVVVHESLLHYGVPCRRRRRRRMCMTRTTTKLAALMVAAAM